MNESVTKLIATIITTNQVHLYFNIYLLTSIYFRAGIIELNKQQEDVLRKIYESPILTKLHLSIKFSKELLYIRKNTLGVGLISPNTALAIARLKLYLIYR